MPKSHRAGLPPAGIGHPRVRQYLDIKRNRRSGSDDTLALEGLWVIRHAVDALLPIEAVFVCPPLLRRTDGCQLVDTLRASGTPTLEVSERVLGRMVDRDGPDGLAAIARWQPACLADFTVGDATSVVVADGVDLPGNLGTIIRTADGAGAKGVITTGRRVRLTHPLVVRASMGTALSMPVADVDREEALSWLRRHGFSVIAADPAATVSYRDADYRGRTAIVLGGERDGLAPFWRDAAHVLVSIPMLGVADSLNVGHAAALLLYEVLRRR